MGHLKEGNNTREGRNRKNDGGDSLRAKNWDALAVESSWRQYGTVKGEERLKLIDTLTEKHKGARNN